MKKHILKDGWYYLDTGYACGGIELKKGLVITTCPIFKKMKNWSKECVYNAITGNKFEYLGK